MSDLDARGMVRSLQTFPLLNGYRGAPRANLNAIEDVLQRVSAMVQAHPEIAELDCNPLVALPGRALIVDARVRVEARGPGLIALWPFVDRVHRVSLRISEPHDACWGGGAAKYCRRLRLGADYGSAVRA